MPSDNFTPNDVWASASPEGVTEELTLPSGQTCAARKMSIQSMIEAGILAESDALTAQVTKHTKKVRVASGPGATRSGKSTPPVREQITKLDENSLLKDPESMTALIGLMDRALPHIVVSPVVVLHYTSRKVGKTTVTKRIEPEDRESGKVYTDQINFMDKVELFNWASGGLGAMLQFRG